MRSLQRRYIHIYVLFIIYYTSLQIKIRFKRNLSRPLWTTYLSMYKTSATIKCCKFYKSYNYTFEAIHYECHYMLKALINELLLIYPTHLSFFFRMECILFHFTICVQNRWIFFCPKFVSPIPVLRVEILNYAHKVARL